MNPEDPADTAAHRALLEDDSRSGMSRRGMARASQFTWAACAKATRAVYDEASARPFPTRRRAKGGTAIVPVG
jgi:glycosyltransferase involved in cell wall biosynthesis